MHVGADQSCWAFDDKWDVGRGLGSGTGTRKNTHVLSLSLSLSHTHTHTHTQGGNRKQNPGKCDEKELSSDRSLIREC